MTDAVSDPREAWFTTADQVAAFTAANGGAPPSMASADPVQKRLARWLSAQRGEARRAQHTNPATPARQEYLDKVLPGWEGQERAADADAIWRARADAIALFHSENGRFPSASGDHAKEAALGMWLATQRRAGAEHFTPERRAYLDRVAPAWEGETSEKAWRERADELAQFISRSDLSTPDAEADAKRIRAWLSNQRAAAKTGRLTPERRAYLDQVAPGWSEPRSATADGDAA